MYDERLNTMSDYTNEGIGHLISFVVHGYNDASQVRSTASRR